MDGDTFEQLLRSLSQSRRSLFPGALAIAAGWRASTHAVAAKDKKKHKKGKR